MQDFDKANFEALIRGIADVFSTTKKVVVSMPLLQVYFMSLNQYSYEQVEWAIGEHLKDPIDGKFFPKPANIIKHLKTNDISVEDKAELAWAQVMREIRVNGAYGSLKLDDRQALAAVKELGTWKELCATPSDKMTFKHREFIATYKTYERTPLEMLPSSMPGLIELQNHKKKQNEESTNAMLNIKNGIDNHRAKLENK